MSGDAEAVIEGTARREALRHEKAAVYWRNQEGIWRQRRLRRLQDIEDERRQQ